jgi:hypothetical protein
MFLEWQKEDKLFLQRASKSITVIGLPTPIREQVTLIICS